MISARVGAIRGVGPPSRMPLARFALLAKVMGPAECRPLRDTAAPIFFLRPRNPALYPRPRTLYGRMCKMDTVGLIFIAPFTHRV